MRYVLDVRYKGTGYSGWQVQPNATTVQGELNRCLETLLREKVSTYGAGRTDAGVHAMHMPAHFDYDKDLHPEFFRSLNAILPHGISINEVYRPKQDNFHARFTATHRAYRYDITFQKDPLLYQRSWWYKEKLDLEALKEGAAILFEFDSFESFCKTNANNKTFFCKIMDSRFEWDGTLLSYHVKADRFLRGMVRAIVGTLFDLGKGKIDADGLREILAARDRSRAGSAAPADGLFLTEVGYPEGSLEKIDFPRLRQTRS